MNINISIGGRVNPELGYCHSFFNFGERPIADILTERMNIDVSIENDSRTMLYGEYIKGAVKGAQKRAVHQRRMGTGHEHADRRKNV